MIGVNKGLTVWAFSLFLLKLDDWVQGAPLRGGSSTRDNLSSLEEPSLIRRQLMEVFQTSEVTERLMEEDPSVRSLLPFSLQMERVLQNENLFRRDLELFLLTSIKEQIPTVEDILLEPAEVPLGERRSLQEAYAVAYRGDAILAHSVGGVGDAVEGEDIPTQDEVREAQFNALLTRSEGSLQNFLNQASSQEIRLTQIQILGFTPVELDPDDTIKKQTGAEEEDEDFNMMFLITIPVVLAVLLICLGGWIYYHKLVKPPPPPAFHPDDLIGTDEEKKLRTPMTENSDRLRSPAGNDDSFMSTDSNQEESVGTRLWNRRGSRPVNLSRPATHANGIETVPVEDRPPPEDDSTFGGMSDIRTVVSNGEESMAGFSLEGRPETETPDSKRSLIESVIRERAAARAAQQQQASSPSSPAARGDVVQTSALARWMSPPSNNKPPKMKKLSKSNSKKQQKSDKELLPKPDEDIDSMVFVNDEDDEEIEVISHASGSYIRGSGGSTISHGSGSQGLALAASGSGSVMSHASEASSRKGGGGGSVASQTSARGGVGSILSHLSRGSSRGGGDGGVVGGGGSVASQASRNSRESRGSANMSVASQSYLKSNVAAREHQEAERSGMAFSASYRQQQPHQYYKPPPDVLSDAPSDEKTINRTAEQDLQGFSASVSSLRSALDGITGGLGPGSNSSHHRRTAAGSPSSAGGGGGGVGGRFGGSSYREDDRSPQDRHYIKEQARNRLLDRS